MDLLAWKENNMNESYKKLFEPIMIGKVQVKNRFFMAPMGTIAEVDENGAYTRRSMEYYTMRAKGGVGMIITGAHFVDNDVEKHVLTLFPNPTIMPEMYEKRAREMTDRCHAFDAKIFMQITAGLGRSALPTAMHGECVAPSPTTNRWVPSVPCRELTIDEIHHITEQMVKSSAIAKRSGYDGVEVHAVHEGYLLDCFTMTFFNQRTDEYGGSLTNRLRFATEIVQGIKKACGPDFPVILRFSIKSYIKALRQGALPGEEFTELGRDMDEALEAAQILQDAGYDAFDADAGSYDSWYWAHPPMYFKKGMYLPLAKRLKETAKVPVLVAGRMDDMDLAVSALENGNIDMVGLGRPLLTDPDYCNKVRADDVKDIRPCLGCHDGCFGRLLEGGIGSCAVNPEVGRESFTGIEPAVAKKRVVVVGGGPAGMEAARVSAIRGHDVTLIEKASALGGELIPGGIPPFKKDDHRLISWYETELEKYGVKIYLNTEADPDLIVGLRPDCLYLAEGSEPIHPALPGADGTNVLDAVQVLRDKDLAAGNCAIIGGGLVGCELGLYLAVNGRQVTIIEALPDILKAGAAIPPMNEWMLRDELKFHHVAVEAGASLTEITPEGAVIEKDGQKRLIPADHVIMAVGYKPKSPLYDALKDDYPQVFRLGDSRKVRNIRAAIWDAYEVARSL